MKPQHHDAAAIHGPEGHEVVLAAAPTGIRIAVEQEGNVRLGRIHSVPLHIAVSPYMWLTAFSVDGTLQYHVHGEPDADASGSRPYGAVRSPAGGGSRGVHSGHDGQTAHDAHLEYEGDDGKGHERSEPSTSVHVGAGGQIGAVGLEAEVQHHLFELFNGSSFDIAAGVEINTNGAHVGVSIEGGHLRFGNDPPLLIGLPSFDVDLVEYHAGHAPEFLVGHAHIPFLATFTIPVPGVMGHRIELIPNLEFVLDFEPNWINIARQIGVDMSAATSEITTAELAADAANTSPEVMEAVAADGEVLMEGAAMEGVLGTAAIGIGACVIAPLAALWFTGAMLDHDVEATARLDAHVQGTAHTLFTYCMSYALTWLNFGALAGPGSVQGEADAQRDMAQFRATHSGRDPMQVARQQWGVQTLYTTVYELMAPRARNYELQRADIEDASSLRGQIVVDAIGAVRWGGEHFHNYLGG